MLQQLRAVVAESRDRPIVDPLRDLDIARCRRIAAVLVETQAAFLEGQAKIVEELTGVCCWIVNERLVPEHELLEMHLATVVLYEIVHGSQMMHYVFDPISTVKAMGHVVGEHREADIERMTYEADDPGIGKCHLHKRQIDLVEGPFIGEVTTSFAQQSCLSRASQIVIAEQSGDIPVISRPCLREMLRESFLAGEQKQRELAQVADERQLAAGNHAGMAAQNLLDQGGARAGKSHDEDGLAHVGSDVGRWQELEMGAREKLLHGAEEFLDRCGAVLQAAGAREFLFGLDEVLPGARVIATRIVQPASLELRLTSQLRRRRFEEGERFIDTMGATEVDGLQEFDIVGGG